MKIDESLTEFFTKKEMYKRIKTFALSEQYCKKMTGKRKKLSKDAFPVQQINTFLMKASILNYDFSMQFFIIFMKNTGYNSHLLECLKLYISIGQDSVKIRCQSCEV